MRMSWYTVEDEKEQSVSVRVYTWDSANSKSIGPEACIRLSRDECLKLADDLKRSAEKLPRHRVGTPADIGCEAL